MVSNGINAQNILQSYPNPTIETLYIDVPNTDNKHFTAYEIAVYNVQGRLLASQKVMANDATKILLNVGHLTTGMYFYEVNGVEQEQTSMLGKGKFKKIM